MAGTLYLVGTPIGNLGDMTPRAVEVLSQVDFIAAEDTRVTGKLLSHFGIAKPQLSYFAHSSGQRARQIVDRVAAGEHCAVDTDAGMPCISDPGEELVALCAQEGVPVQVVPGPSAAVSALALSGLPTSRFSFEGFLSTTRKNRLAHLEEVRHSRNTLIFYEAPHKLQTTLKDLLEALGDRRISLCRELTKLHEEVIRTTLSQAVAYYEGTPPRGEFVLVVEGETAMLQQEKPDFDSAVTLVLGRVRQGESLSAAAKAVSGDTGWKKGTLYRAAAQIQEDAEPDNAAAETKMKKEG